MELLTIFLFSAALLACVAAQISVLYALAAGYIIFFSYALLKGHKPLAILKMSLSGIKTVKNILISFMLIGMLTALWRAAGTISVIVCYASAFIRPAVVVLMAFLLNCLVSFLTGTSFGTAATMGVISMTVALTMGVNPIVTGGAILAGTFFGDRCSPVSTSALLVSELTGTNLFHNIGLMMRTAAVPFLITCGIYGALGVLLPHGSGGTAEIYDLFAGSFHLGWVALLPAVIILALSLMKINVRWTMSASILCALILCVCYQNTAISQLPELLFTGYHAADPELSAMMDGGGILSMVRTAAIIAISSSYAGIFQETGLLEHLKERIITFGRKTSPYAAILCTSIVAAVISCNQTLAIMLTDQLCDTVEPDHQKRAIDLEDTAVVIAPLVPWSIACAVPLTSVSAPTASILAACYLYLLPLYRLLVQMIGKGKQKTEV